MLNMLYYYFIVMADTAVLKACNLALPCDPE